MVAHVYVHMYLHVCMCVDAWGLYQGSSSIALFLIYWGKVSAEPRAPDMAGLDSLFRDLLSVSEYQDYRVAVSTQLLGFLFVGPGDLNSGSPSRCFWALNHHLNPIYFYEYVCVSQGICLYAVYVH